MAAYQYFILIRDSEIKESAKSFKSYLNVLNEAVVQYKTIINNICSTSIQSGKTHDALMEYLNYVIELEMMTDQLGDKYQRVVRSFLTELESIDDYLYDSKIAANDRDFTEEQYEHLVNCLDDPWCSVTDNFGDKIIGLFFNGEKAKKKLQDCHKFLLDYNNETLQGLTVIFNNAHALDREYGKSIAGATTFDGDYCTSYFDSISLTLFSIRDALDAMSELINPDNGSFNISNINNKLDVLFREIREYYDETMAIPEVDTPIEITHISDFASQPWAQTYFSGFYRPVSMYIGDMGGYEAFVMTISNMFEISKDKILYGDYDVYILKKQMLSVLSDMSKDYKYAGSDEESVVKDCKDFIGYVKKHGENWYEYLNKTRDENGKLLLDGRTKSAKEFKSFLDSLGGAEKILKYGNEGIDYISKLFADYTYGLRVLDSFDSNYSDSDNVSDCVDEIKSLYNKEFGAWVNEALNRAKEIGFGIAIAELAKAVPVVAVVNNIEKTIDVVGEWTGIGSKGKSMYDSLIYHELSTSSTEAYRKALEKFQQADINSEEYGKLAEDVKNCFELHKKNMISLYRSMAGATDGTKKSYYHYCEKVLMNSTMKDSYEPQIMSYEEFLEYK